MHINISQFDQEKPESETVDHPRKREEKTQNTDSHTTIKQEQPTELERTRTTPQKLHVRTQHKMPHKSDKNQAMDMEF